MKFTNIDKRMLGYGSFRYAIDFTVKNGGTAAFVKIRAWATETLGPTVEIDLWTKHPEFRNPSWSWDRVYTGESMRCKIYLASDSELTLVALRWEE